MDGIVWHQPIPQKISDTFSEEFSELLPRRLGIPTENDLFIFEFTSAWAGIVAQYIIGIAAKFSGDLDYAENLFNNAYSQLNYQNKNFPIYSKLVERIPKRISEIYELRAARAHIRWHKTRDPVYIDEIGDHLQCAQEGHENNHGVYFLSAIYEFLKNKDIKKAIAYLNLIPGVKNNRADKNIITVWNLSMAFLYAYDENMATAIRHYRKASNYEINPEIIDQTESFICWALEQEPEKVQLYYCLGFFNWVIKGDIVSANNDFDNFLSTCDPEKFSKEIELTNKWKKVVSRKW